MFGSTQPLDLVAAAPAASMPRSPPRVDILGVGVSAINMAEALAIIDGWIQERAPRYVCVTDAHGVVAGHRDERLRAIQHRAGLVTPDGMPLVWLCRLAGHQDVGRVYGPDLMLALCEHSLARGYRHFFYGGGEGVAEQLAARLSRRFPGLAVAGTFSPPFRRLTKEEDDEIVRRIGDSGADIVWIGLGTPKQELWMADHVERMEAAVLIGVGAAFDFHSGRKRQAPYWIQRSGFEWLFRLATEPRRLWRRYLGTVPAFIVLMLMQKFRIVKFSIAPRARRTRGIPNTTSRRQY